MKEQILKHEAVESHSEFAPENGVKVDRTYLNLKGATRHMAGDRTSKVWFDNKTGELCYSIGKGLCSSEYNASLSALKDAFPMVRK